MQRFLNTLKEQGVQAKQKQDRKMLEHLVALGLPATVDFEGIKYLENMNIISIADTDGNILTMDNLPAIPSFALYIQPDAVLVKLYRRCLSQEVKDRMKEITLEQARTAPTFEELYAMVDGCYRDIQTDSSYGPCWLDSPERVGQNYCLSDLVYAQGLLPKLEQVFPWEEVARLEKRYGFRLKPEVCSINITEFQRELRAGIQDSLDGTPKSERNTPQYRRVSNLLLKPLSEGKDQLDIFVQYVLDNTLTN